MTNENHENYVKALAAPSKSSRKQEKSIKIFLSPEIIKLLKDIKSLMELENNSVINSAIAFFYNNKFKINDDQLQKISSKIEGKSLEYIATPKNDQRIKDTIAKSDYPSESMQTLIIISAIKAFHKVLNSDAIK